jgi:hypothetical protein
MYDRSQILTYLKNKKQIFKEKYSVSKIGIFGSYSRNSQTEKSDLDIILDFEGEINDIVNVKKSIRNEIKYDLKINVDICREKYINKNFKELILSETIYV